MIKKKKDTFNFKIFSESPSGENVKETHSEYKNVRYQ